MFILITLSFNAMAIRLMLPVMPELIHNIISGTLGIDGICCDASYLWLNFWLAL